MLMEYAARRRWPDVFGEMRRAEHGNAVNLTSVKQFAGDQARFDRLAEPSVVRDEQVCARKLERLL